MIFESSVDLDGYLYWMQQNIGIEQNKKKWCDSRRVLNKKAIFHSFNTALRLNKKHMGWGI
jgi:hypothetical protein